MKMRRNMAKLELYRKFTNALAVSVLLSIAWIGFEVMFIFLFYPLNYPFVGLHQKMKYDNFIIHKCIY